MQGLKAKSLLQDTGDTSYGVSVHDLYFELIEMEVKSGAWDTARFVWYNGEEAHPLDLRVGPRGDFKRFSLKYDASKFVSGWKKTLEGVKWQNLSKVEVLQLFISDIEVLNVGDLPNLKSMVLKWGDRDIHPNHHVNLIGLGKLRNLGWLELWNIHHTCFMEIEWLTTLEVLRLGTWRKQKRGPLAPVMIAQLPNLHMLTKLQVLELNSIPIKSLPSLDCLALLKVLCCTELHLARLPDLSELSLLESIDLRSCHELTTLDNFGNLPALRYLNVFACSKLERLPDLRSSKKLRFLVLCRSGIRLFSKDIAILAKLEFNVRVFDDDQFNFSEMLEKMPFLEVVKKIEAQQVKSSITSEIVG